MAPRPNSQHVRGPGLSLRLVALVFTMTWNFSVTENQLKGEVGGNVTFHCPVDKQKEITFLYLQRGTHTFVNGFYVSKEVPRTWGNTKLDSNKELVYMNNLNVSHRGDYECSVLYSDSQAPHVTRIHLIITANYSKPEVTMDCDGRNCSVTCTAHGGYPSAKMTWDGTEIQQWKSVRGEETSDPVTLLVNSSGTALVNCSRGRLELSCSVANVTSDRFSVCTSEDPPDMKPLVIAAICVVVAVLIIALALALIWKRRRRSGSAAVASSPECGEQGCPQEKIVLNGKAGEVES